MYQDYAVGEHKANKGLRFANYIIDLISIYAILFIVLIILILIEHLLKGYSDIELFFDKMSNFTDRVFTSIFYCLGMFLIEYLTKGRSLGKFITGTKVVMIDGSVPTTKDYFMRNICRIIPFDQLSFFATNGWHDKFSKTTVVNKKDFETAISFDQTIESIGNENI